MCAAVKVAWWCVKSSRACSEQTAAVHFGAFISKITMAKAAATLHLMSATCLHSEEAATADKASKPSVSRGTLCTQTGLYSFHRLSARPRPPIAKRALPPWSFKVQSTYKPSPACCLHRASDDTRYATRVASIFHVPLKGKTRDRMSTSSLIKPALVPCSL